LFSKLLEKPLGGTERHSCGSRNPGIFFWFSTFAGTMSGFPPARE
jgi:hypothetical protein